MMRITFNLYSKLCLLVLCLFAFISNGSAFAASSGAKLESAHHDIFDDEAIKNGASVFVNNCSACHSLELMRLKRFGEDLNLAEQEVLSRYAFSSDSGDSDVSISDSFQKHISAKQGEALFGIAPPDLSLTARVRGVDWIYTFLKSYYQDTNQANLVNNKVFSGTAMPHIFSDFQGTFNKKGDSIHPGTLDTEQFDLMLKDLVTFLDYVAEPAKRDRLQLGWKVIAFLLLLLVLTVWLKKEYWRDIKKSS